MSLRNKYEGSSIDHYYLKIERIINMMITLTDITIIREYLKDLIEEIANMSRDHVNNNTMKKDLVYLDLKGFCDTLEDKRTEKAKILLTAKDILEDYSDGSTPMHFAAGYYNIYPLLDKLIESKMNVDVVDSNGRTPLLHAVRNNQNEAVRCLIENKADVDAKSYFGGTPTLQAYSQPDILALLLINNGNPNACINTTGQTILRAASSAGCHDSIKLLIDYNAEEKIVLDERGFYDRDFVPFNNRAMETFSLLNQNRETPVKVSKAVYGLVLLLLLKKLVINEITINIILPYLVGTLPYLDETTERFQSNVLTIKQTVDIQFTETGAVDDQKTFEQSAIHLFGLLKYSSHKQEAQSFLEKRKFEVEEEVRNIVRTSLVNNKIGVIKDVAEIILEYAVGRKMK